MKFTKTERRWLLEKVSRQHIRNWEAGKGVNIKYLPLIAKVRGITVDDLVAEILRNGNHIEKAG